uniref:Uncharacterized protein MANES_01G142700 n=1 Tax=Rhizophora mucronata TaxID=61149 RepID=A0A2P2JND4_RHIMU
MLTLQMIGFLELHSVQVCLPKG